MRKAGASHQRGAALILVLLLVGTLSFVAFALSERTTLAGARTAGVRARGELLWRAAGAEALARRAIEAAYETDGERMTVESLLLAKPIEVPMEGGRMVVSVRDRTRCFNINSLVMESGDANDSAVEEFLTVLSAAGIHDPNRLAAAILDWIDANSLQEPGGAEDDVYTLSPTPYRTGGRKLAAISELRAMRGFDRSVYRTIAPYVCVQPETTPSPVNVNLVTLNDAPLIMGILGREISVADIQGVIEDRPPGGYESVSDFLAHERFKSENVSESASGRLSLTSQYLEVDAAIEYYGAPLHVSMMFEVSSGRARLFARRLGWSGQ